MFLQCRMRPSSFWTILTWVKRKSWRISSQRVINFLMQMLTYNWIPTIMAEMQKLIIIVKKLSQTTSRKHRSKVRSGRLEPRLVVFKERLEETSQMACRSSEQMSNWKALRSKTGPMEIIPTPLNNRLTLISSTGTLLLKRTAATPGETLVKGM